MKKCIKLLSLLFILLFTVSVKAKTLTEAEYKELKIDRAYILCDYVFDMKNGFNPTLRDFLLASQTCPKNNVTIYEIKYSKDINGNDQKTFTELLANKKTTIFPSLNVKYIYNKSIDYNPNTTLDDTPTNIDYSMDTTPFNEERFQGLGIKRSYVIGAYIFKVGADFNPSLKDILIANQTNPKGEVSIYEISYAQDINGNNTKTYTELLSGNRLPDFPKMNLRYYYQGNIIPNNPASEKKTDLMETDTITYTLGKGSFTYNGSNPNIQTATAKSNLPITYKVYSGSSCKGDELEEYKNVGTYSALASTEGNTIYAKVTKCVVFRVTPKAYNSTDFTIAIDQTGDNFVNPLVTIKTGETVLIEGTDYDLDRKNPGVIIVTFKNNYSGTTPVRFSIEIKDFDFEQDNNTKSFVYDGTAKTFILTPKNQLPQNYTILYGDSDCSENECTQTVKPTFTNVGNYTVYYIVTADHYNTYFNVATVTINKAQDEITLTEKSGMIYEINEGKVANTATHTGDGELTYTYYTDSSCTENGTTTAPINAGTYYAQASTVDTANYKGGKSSCVRHLIAPKDGNTTTITLDPSSYDYNNGEEIRPEPVVKDGDTVLVKDTDYTLGYSNNTAVGTGKVLVSFRGNYTNNGQTFEVPFTINGLDMTVTPSPASVVYDGQSHSITDSQITVSVSGVTIKYSSERNGNYTSQKPTFIAAGDHTTYVEVTKEGYNTQYADVILTITPAPGSVTFNPVDTTYNGLAQPVTATCVGDYNVSYNYYSGTDTSCTGNSTTEAPVNASVYYVKATCTATSTNYSSLSSECKRYEISPKTLSANNVTLGYTTTGYDGEEKKPSVTVTDNGTNLSINTDYTLSYTDNINVGTATVTVALTGNYTGSIPKTFEITPGTITVSATGGTYTYEPGTSRTITVSPTPSDTTLRYGTSSCEVNGACTLTELPTYTNAGTYNICYIATKENYNNATGCRTITINPKQDTITCSAASDLVYNGEPQGNNNACTTTSNTTDITRVYYLRSSCSPSAGDVTSCTGPGLDSGGAPTNAGEYIMKVTTNPGDNYVSATAYIPHTIAKKEGSTNTITLDEESGVYQYTGSAIKPIVTIKDGTRTVGTDNYDVEYSNNTAVGTGKVSITYKNNYYTQNPVEVEFTIATQDEITLTKRTGMVYKRGERKIANTATHTGDGELTYTYYTDSSCTQNGTTTAPIDAGMYYVQATSAATTNYAAGASACVEHKISQKPIDINNVVISPDTYVYDGTAKEPSVTITDDGYTLVGCKQGTTCENYDYIYYYQNNVNVTTTSYETKVTFACSGNYDGSGSKGFSITGKSFVTNDDYRISVVEENNVQNLKISIKKSIIEPEGVVLYTGDTSPASNVTALTSEETVDDVVYKYVLIPYPTTEGTHTIYYKITASNYNERSGSASITITPPGSGN